MKIIITENKGNWLRAICNYFSLPHAYSLEIAEGCSLKCIYCILKTYLSHNSIRISGNFFDQLESIHAAISSHKDPLFISTGILTDSLLIQSIFPYFEGIAYLARKNPNALFEFRSKIADLSFLDKNHQHGGNIIFSWSMSPQYIIDQTEAGVASMEKRIGAAMHACAYGYKIGFHLDPIINYPQWKNKYCELLEYIFDSIAPTHIQYFSLGTLRFPGHFRSFMHERYPHHWVFQDEFVPVYKDTYSYLRATRKTIYGELIDVLKRK